MHLYLLEMIVLLMRKLLKVTKKSLVSFRFGVFSCDFLMCGVFCHFFMDGDDITPTQTGCTTLVSNHSKSTLHFLDFLRLIILCSAHFQQRATKITPFEMEGSYHSKMPRGLWWIGMLDCLTTHCCFFSWNFCPKQKKFIMDPNSNGLWLTLWE